ncbi:hypothetical protein Lser_V15G03844 [Lactuca serriola]
MELSSFNSSSFNRFKARYSALSSYSFILHNFQKKKLNQNISLPSLEARPGRLPFEINVLQGEREFVRDIKSLGSFRLDGIPRAPRGVPQIEVKFDIYANGSVKRMVNEVEKFEKEDKEKREAIDTKNQADSVVYQTEKQLKELGEKVPATVKEMVEEKLGLLKEAISGGSTQTIIDAMAALN